jgi:hypothetical protein
MKFLMDRIVKELVEEAWESTRLGRSRHFGDKDRVFAEALSELESQGDAMRYLDGKGRVCWKATPELKDYLLDRQRDAQADLEDEEV